MLRCVGYTHIHDRPLLLHIINNFTCYYHLQVKDMPPSVTGRHWHSLNAITSSESCVWLLAVGGYKAFFDMASNCVFLELSELLNEIPSNQTDRTNE